MPSLSVIIITFNEAHDIRACLESVKWADEIIVLDSGSTDKTVAICKEYTAKVFVTDWPGYGIQKQRALQYAQSDWILSLDADERISSALHQALIQAINTQDYHAYKIPFHSFFCGQRIYYGAWHSKSHVRLFKRNSGHFDDAVVHENLMINGNIGKINEAIQHYTYHNLNEMLRKINDYSSAGAQLRHTQNKKGSLLTAITHALWSFAKGYIIQLGFLDGKAGFIIAVANAEYAYYRYLKLMYLTNK